QLIQFRDQVELLIQKKNMKKDDALFNVLRDEIKHIKTILFEGDGYSETWEKEAAKRGLSNNKTTPDALSAFISKASITLFERQNVLTARELEARYTVDLEEYTMHVQIEARTLGDIARNHVIPTAVKYQNTLIENVRGLKEIYGAQFKPLAAEQMALIERISSHIAEINSGVNQMIEARKKANSLDSSKEKAQQYRETVFPFLDRIRYHCDKLELLVDDQLWPMSKYRELLFNL
ncbi:MAG: glutamine synthetase type III, partial [Flavobacteriaceae bacterium]